MKSALIIIDVQNYFLNDATKHLPVTIAAHIKAYQYDHVILTKFVNQKGSNWEQQLGWYKCYGSPETDLAVELASLPKTKTFEKTSYSIFGAADFVTFLHENDVKKLYLCGVDTDACVLASAYDAFDGGYHVIVLEDLCGSHYGEAAHQHAVDIIQKNLVGHGSG